MCNDIWSFCRAADIRDDDDDDDSDERDDAINDQNFVAYSNNYDSDDSLR